MYNHFVLLWRLVWDFRENGRDSPALYFKLHLCLYKQVIWFGGPSEGPAMDIVFHFQMRTISLQTTSFVVACAADQVIVDLFRETSSDESVATRVMEVVGDGKVYISSFIKSHFVWTMHIAPCDDDYTTCKITLDQHSGCCLDDLKQYFDIYIYVVRMRSRSHISTMLIAFNDTLHIYCWCASDLYTEIQCRWKPSLQQDCVVISFIWCSRNPSSMPLRRFLHEWFMRWGVSENRQVTNGCSMCSSLTIRPDGVSLCVNWAVHYLQTL